MVAARASSPSGGTIGPMRRLLTWLVVTIGIAALVRRLRRRRDPAARRAHADVARRRSCGRAPAQARGVSGRGAGRGAGAARGDRRGPPGRRARARSCRARRHARLREGVAHGGRRLRVDPGLRRAGAGGRRTSCWTPCRHSRRRWVGFRPSCTRFARRCARYPSRPTLPAGATALRLAGRARRGCARSSGRHRAGLLFHGF